MHAALTSHPPRWLPNLLSARRVCAAIRPPSWLSLSKSRPIDFGSRCPPFVYLVSNHGNVYCQRRYLLCDNSTNNPLTIVFSGDRRQLHHIITGTHTHTHSLARTPQINTKQQKPLFRLLHTAYKHTQQPSIIRLRAHRRCAGNYFKTGIDFVRPSRTHTCTRTHQILANKQQ